MSENAIAWLAIVISCLSVGISVGNYLRARALYRRELTKVAGRGFYGTNQ